MKKNLALRRPAKNDWGNDEALSETVTARYFRLQTDVPLDVQEVELSAVASIGNFWGRTGSAKTVYAELPSIGSAPISSIIDSASVIDLSNQLDAGGRLKAELPKGLNMLRQTHISTLRLIVTRLRLKIGLRIMMRCSEKKRDIVSSHFYPFLQDVLLIVLKPLSVSHGICVICLMS